MMGDGCSRVVNVEAHSIHRLGGQKHNTNKMWVIFRFGQERGQGTGIILVGLPPLGGATMGTRRPPSTQLNLQRTAGRRPAPTRARQATDTLPSGRCCLELLVEVLQDIDWCSSGYCSTVARNRKVGLAWFYFGTGGGGIGCSTQKKKTIKMKKKKPCRDFLQP